MLMKTEAIYHTNEGQQAGFLTGRNLAHGKRTVPERAFVGADLHLNRVKLISPTVKQCAYLAGVCVPYVAAAVEVAIDERVCPDRRDAVLNGDLGLLEAAKAGHSESLAAHFARATPEEWLEAAKAIGPAVVLDYMIAPIV
jgi:hypothetical protein